MQEYTLEDRKDFGKDDTKAKEVSKVKYDEQKNRMPREQVNALDKIKQKNCEEVKQLNIEMDRNSLDVIKDKKPQLAEVHEKLEKLMGYAEKCQAGKTVYLSITPVAFGKSDNSYFDDKTNPNKIDNDKLLQFISEDSNFANFNGYMVAGLHSKSLDTGLGERILIPVELQKGISILHLGDGNVIIDKDIPMEKKDVTIIAYNGRQIINWKLKQISTERFSELIRKSQEELNKSTGEKFKIEGFDRIKFDLKSMLSATSAARAWKVVDYMVDCIPHELFKHTYNTQSHISSTKFQIVFQDKEEADSDIESYDMGGYDPNLNILFIYPVNVKLNDSELQKNFQRVVIHEFGHAFDWIVLYHTIDHSDPKNFKFSDTIEFKMLYLDEKDNLTEKTSHDLYGQIKPSEYFADVFSAMFAKDNDIRILIWKQVPKTCQYINQHILKIIPL